MGAKFRIFDRFTVTGRGTVYMLKPDKGAVVRIGESLYDLHGNEFRVSKVEMPTRCWGNTSESEEMPIGIAVESVNCVEVQGDFLFKDLSDVKIESF